MNHHFASRARRRARGFTLVELILVMVIVGVIAGVLALQLGPAFQSYAAVARRANLTQQADTALRRVVSEVRTAVPNSLRNTANGTTSCLEMVPTSDGGRFRIAADPAIATSDALDLSQPDASFEVLTDFTVAPSVGASPDWVVIGNQNTDDVYTGVTRAQLKTLTPASLPAVPATPAGYANAPYRTVLTLAGAKQFPPGYEGGRFAVVPDAQQAVSYVCSGAATVNGTGTGTLQRISHYGWTPSQTCPPPTGGNTATVASKVSSCSFVYSPSQSLTQQSGYVTLQLTLTDGGEPVTLTVGSQVENVP